MSRRTFFFISGVFWAVMMAIFSILTVASIVQGRDYHHVAVMGLLYLLLANQAFDRASR